MTKFAVIEHNTPTVLPNGNTLGSDHWRATCITEDEQYARDWFDCAFDGRERKILKSDDDAYVDNLYGSFIKPEEVEQLMPKLGEFV